MNTSFTDTPPTCPACDGASLFMFTLGNIDLWVCILCALQFDTPANDDPDGDWEEW